MTDLRDLPDQVSELVELSKEYLRQEALGPLRGLGRLVGFSLGAAALFAIGAVLLAVAGTRALLGLLPEPWTWAGYVGSGLVVAGAAGALLWGGRR